jgi:hypothetical protein
LEHSGLLANFPLKFNFTLGHRARKLNKEENQTLWAEQKNIDQFLNGFSENKISDDSKLYYGLKI